MPSYAHDATEATKSLHSATPIYTTIRERPFLLPPASVGVPANGSSTLPGNRPSLSPRRRKTCVGGGSVAKASLLIEMISAETNGNTAQPHGVCKPTHGVCHPAHGICYPAHGICYPAHGICKSTHRVCHPSDGRSSLRSKWFPGVDRARDPPFRGRCVADARPMRRRCVENEASRSTLMNDHLSGGAAKETKPYEKVTNIPQDKPADLLADDLLRQLRHRIGQRRMAHE